MKIAIIITAFTFYIAFQSQCLKIIQQFIKEEFNQKQLKDTPAPSNSHSLGPIIGMVTQPTGYSVFDDFEHMQWLDGPCTQLVESLGARVVPIFYNSSDTELEFIFAKINGLFIPGGEVPIFTQNGGILKYSLWAQRIRVMLEIAKKQNYEGRHFPVYGVCLGFQTILVLSSSPEVLQNVYNETNRAETITFSTNYSRQALKQTILYQFMDDADLDNAENREMFLYWHSQTVTPTKFLESQDLADNFVITAISYTINGTEFIASFEGKYFPFFGTQYHPCRAPLVFIPSLNADHSFQSIQFNTKVVSAFVEESRKSPNHFASYQEEMQYLIYNFNSSLVLNDFFAIKTYFFPDNKTII